MRFRADNRKEKRLRHQHTVVGDEVTLEGGLVQPTPVFSERDGRANVYVKTMILPGGWQKVE